MEYRIERDSMGEVRVPADRYWGAQAQRSHENFPIGVGIETMPAGGKRYCRMSVMWMLRYTGRGFRVSAISGLSLYFSVSCRSLGYSDVTD